MATLVGNYKESNIATIPAAATLVDAFLTSQDARMIAMGGHAEKIDGTVTYNIRAVDGTAVVGAHKLSGSINTLLIANALTVNAALEVAAIALEAQSSFTTVTEVDVTVHTVMSN